MNPMLQAFLTSILRWAFTFVAGFLVNHAVLSANEAERYTAAAAIAAVTLLWSLWAKYHSRLKFLTALQMPQDSTEADVNARIADPLVVNPSVLTKKTDIP